MPNGADNNGAAAAQLPRRARVKDLLEALRHDHGVSEEFCELLGEAFSRAAVRVVDDVVNGRQQPAITAYYIARQFDGDVWWKR
jgi:hypothetical protein